MSGGGVRSVPTTTNQNTTQNSTTSQDISGSTFSGSQTQLPDWLRQAGPDLYGRGLGFLDHYQGSNPLLDMAGQQASQFGANSAGHFDTAAGWFGNDRGGDWAQQAMKELMGIGSGGGGGYNANLGGGGGGPSPGIDKSKIRDVNYKDFTDYDINKYLNPYTQSVVDTTLSDVQRNADIQSMQRASAAAKAGAFGGSRHGVLDALASGETLREMGGLSSKLHSDAFNAAAGLIHGDQTGDLSAQQSNQNADLQSQIAALQSSTQLQANAHNGSIQAQIAANNNRLQALQSVLGGGIDLGKLDIARGGAFQGLGESSFDRLSQLGVTQNQIGLQPFQIMQGLGSMLGSLPYEQSTNNWGLNNGNVSGTQNTTGTLHGTGTTPIQQQDNTGQYIGAAVALASLFM